MHPRPLPGDSYFLNIHDVKGYASLRYGKPAPMSSFGPSPLNELATQFAAQLCGGLPRSYEYRRAAYVRCEVRTERNRLLQWSECHESGVACEFQPCLP